MNGFVRRLTFVFLVLLYHGQNIKAQNSLLNVKPGQYERHLIHNGRDRSYILHIPPQYNSKDKLPLVLLFHGGGGNARQALRAYGLVEKADKEGFILVAPNGTGRFDGIFTWNVIFGFGYAKRNHVDDIGFVEKVIDQVEQQLKIDSRGVFATGISNGGFLCHFLAAHLSEKIAAIAPVAASVGGKERVTENFIFPPAPKKPVSVVAFNGLLDQRIPYLGGKQKKSFGVPIYVTSYKQMCSFWVKANQCDPKPQIEKTADYIKIRYQKGKERSEVVQYLIFGHGHAWPGGKRTRLRADIPSKRVNATDIMWEFFKRHYRAENSERQQIGRAHV